MKTKGLTVLATVIMAAFGIVIVLSTIVFSSCGKVPQDKIDAVLTSIDSIDTSKFNVDQLFEYRIIQDSVKAIMGDIVKTHNMNLFRNFKPEAVRLDSLLGKIIQFKGNFEKIIMKKNADSLLAGLKFQIKENIQLIEKANKNRKGKMIVKNLKNEICLMDSSYAIAKSIIDKGSYMFAQNKINKLKANADIINNKLKGALK